MMFGPKLCSTTGRCYVAKISFTQPVVGILNFYRFPCSLLTQQHKLLEQQAAVHPCVPACVGTYDKFVTQTQEQHF